MGSPPTFPDYRKMLAAICPDVVAARMGNRSFSRPGALLVDIALHFALAQTEGFRLRSVRSLLKSVTPGRRIAFQLPCPVPRLNGTAAERGNCGEGKRCQKGWLRL